MADNNRAILFTKEELNILFTAILLLSEKISSTNLNKTNVKKFVNKISSLITPEFYGIKNYSYNSNNTLDVKGNVDLSFFKHLKKLPFRFNEVEGDFICSFNNLISLKGAPKKVGGNFYCNRNNLKTLEGAPREVIKNFCCSENDLITLKGSPNIVGGNFFCDFNSLPNLEGAPKKVIGDFYCYHNKLESLAGIGEVLGEIFFSKDFLKSEE